MCGLSGFLALSSSKELNYAGERKAKNLMVLSQLRGFDSAGSSVLWRQQVHPKHRSKSKYSSYYGWVTSRTLGSPYTSYTEAVAEVEERYLRTKSKKDHLEPPEIFGCIGHSRAATLGEVTVDNAHPFRFNNNQFIGVHNGTIDNAAYIYNTLSSKGTPRKGTVKTKADYGNVKSSYTDSERVLYCIYRYGIEAVLPLIEGAYAFVWYDELDGKIHFIRNSKRSLFYFVSIIDNTLHWVSEKEMMEYGINYSTHYRTWSETSSANPVLCFNVHTHYAVECRNPRSVSHHSPFRWDIEESLASLLPEKKPVISTGAGGRYSCSSSDKYIPTVYSTKGEGKRWSYTKNTLVTLTEWEKEQAEKEQKKETAEDTDAGRCVWCYGDLDSEEITGKTLHLKSTGTLCGCCVEDTDVLDAFMDVYPESSSDPEMIKRYCDLIDSTKETT